MRFDVVTIFPEFFDSMRVSQIWNRALDKGLIEFQAHDLRNFADDRHRTVDDAPYGGGPGMVLKVEPLAKAVESIPRQAGAKVLYASPQGRQLTHAWANELAEIPQLIIVAGRYEGVDERFVDGWVDEMFSIGDYVLSGGELPAAVLMETTGRLIPGVVGDYESVTTDSFVDGGLKYPQYTRPSEFRGRSVPEALLSGDHAKIEQWRKSAALEKTKVRRPDLLGSV